MAIPAIVLTCAKGYSIGKAVWGTFKSVLGFGDGKTVYAIDYPVGKVLYVVEDNKFYIQFPAPKGSLYIQRGEKFQLSTTEMQALYKSGVDFEKVSKGYVKVTSPNDVLKDENFNNSTTQLATFGILGGIILFGFLMIKR